MEPMTNSAAKFFNEVMQFMEDNTKHINDEITKSMLQKFLRFVRDEVCVDDERYTFDDAMQVVGEDNWEFQDGYVDFDEEW